MSTPTSRTREKPIQRPPTLDEIRAAHGLHPRAQDATMTVWTQDLIAKRKAFFIYCLYKRLGVLSLACEDANVPHQTYYGWRQNDEDFAASCDRAYEVRLDFAEAQLMANIQNGKEASLIFFLKTQGRRRGYIERQEVSGPDGQPISLADATIREELPMRAMQRILLKTVFKGTKVIDVEATPQ